MRSWLLPGILTSALALLAASPALAGQNHAVQCNPTVGSVGSVEYSQFGVHNFSGSPRTIHCGGFKGFNLFSTMGATVYDRSNVDDVRCAVIMTNSAGQTLFSTSSSTAGFGSAAMSLSFGLPSFAGYIDMQCSIPAVTSFGLSHVTTFDIP